MGRTGMLAAVVLLLAAGRALAQDAGGAAPSVADDVAALASDDARRAQQAVEALAGSKPEAAAEIVAAAASHVTKDSVWAGLLHALARWEGESGADALSRLRVSWPAAANARLDKLVCTLRAVARPTPLPELGTSPPDVAEKVAAVLAKYESTNSYRWPNPDAAEIAKLGRDAIPALVAALRHPSASENTTTWIAADALALLLEERDLPLAADLLRARRWNAARALARLRSPALLDLVVACVERDLIGDDLLAAGEAQGDTPRLLHAVTGWVERNPHRCGEMTAAARFVARHRHGDAAAPLLAALRLSSEGYATAEIASALATLGEREGIEVLVELVGARVEASARHVAGRALDDVSKRSIYGPHARFGRQIDEQDVPAVAAQFKAWWEESKDRLVFDRDTGRWRDPDAAALAFPESPPGVAAKVRAFLDRVAAEQKSSWSPHESQELVDLGRDAVPELLRQLRDRAASRSSGAWRTVRAVTWALEELAREEDVPFLAQLLADGSSDAASVLGHLRGEVARDALLTGLARGHASHELARGLLRHAAQPSVQAAVLAWIRTQGAGHWALGPMAEVAGGGGGDAARAALSDLLGRRRVEEDSRAAVAAAIARLGGRDGIEELVRIAASEERGATDAAVALNGISGREIFRTRTYGPIGRSGNIDEASAWFRAWWEKSKESLRYDPSLRAWTTDAPGVAPEFGESPPEVAAEVERLLSGIEAKMRIGVNFEDEARPLADLGRDAVPALLRHLAGSASRSASSARLAAEALRRLRTDADVPVLASLLDRGCLAAATSLAGCQDPRAREALLAAVARGEDDMTLFDVLGEFPVDAATWEAVRASLAATKSTERPWLAKFLDENATAEAAPLLEETLAREGLDDLFAVRCASALARVGGRAGVEALLRLVEEATAPTNWSQDPREFAAESLNSVAGRRYHVGSRWNRLPGEADPVFEPAALAAKFRAWWAEEGARVRFDGVRRGWTTSDRKPVRLGAPPPELAMEVTEILGRARVSRIFSFGIGDHLDPHAAEVVALGRDAIPALVARLRSRPPWNDESYVGNDVRAAEQALGALATGEDAPLMADLLMEGRLGLAAWFAEEPDVFGRDAALEVVGRGFLDGDLLRVLRPFADDEVVHEALVTWAEEFGAAPLTRFAFGHGEDGDDDALVATLLAPVLGPALGGAAADPARDAAAPPDPSILERPIAARLRWRLAAELARHGAKPAVAVLVDLFAPQDRSAAAPGVTGAGAGAERGPPTSDRLGTSDAVAVGSLLNEMAGTTLVEFEERAPEMPRLGRRIIHRFGGGDDTAKAVKDRAAAASRVRAWWEANAERLRFDRVTRRWKSGD